MKKALLLLNLLGVSLLSLGQTQPDTITVQTLTYSSTGRSGMFQFPDDTSHRYQKIIMQYSMRCKNGLVSNSTDRNKGCGEWDYSCHTFITDSSRVDSLKKQHLSHIIPNFSGSAFKISNTPTYTYYAYNQKNMVYTATTSETSGTIGTGTDVITFPFLLSQPSGRTQILLKASELSGAGITSGNITGLKLDFLSSGQTINFLKFKLKTTTATDLSSGNIDAGTFTEVYFLNTPITANGLTSFNFHTPFNWNGTSNLILDISYNDKNANGNLTLNGTTGTSTLSLHNNTYDGAIEFANSSPLSLNPQAMNTISNEITISFWSYGNAAKLPMETTLFEASDNSNNRMANTHLPWSDSKVYWDCGNDGTGYDRIEKAASAADFEGKWNHWTFVKNATTGSMKIYLNGTLWHSGTGKTKTMTITKFNVGGAVTWTNGYHGKVDEFSVWNKELSASEIQAVMYKHIDPTHPKYANLVAYYQFNEASGNTYNDMSPNALTTTSMLPVARIPIMGESLFSNFTKSNARPNITLVKGVYTSTLQTITVRDSIENIPVKVMSYSLSNDTIYPVDTIYYHKSGYMPVYSTTGAKIDSVLATVDSTINVVTYNYFQRSPGIFEIMSFVTPYGIGLDLGAAGKTWEFDVTDFGPFLKGNKYLFMTAGGEYQEQMDIKFLYIKGTPFRDVLSIQQIWPGNQGPSYAEIVADAVHNEPRNITLRSDAAAFKIRTTISGHGQNGEFIKRTHFMNLNGGTKEFSWQVWKECASNPVYPQGGTWVFDRAGWCPGMSTDTKEMDITSMVSPGQTVTFDYGINTVSNLNESWFRNNHQLVQYGPAKFSIDAAINLVKRPTKLIEFGRNNPICNEPLVVVKNTGSTAITSVKLEYGLNGGLMKNYTWTGNIAYATTAEISLPIDSAGYWYTSTSNNFKVNILEVNGAADNYAENNSYTTVISRPDKFAFNNIIIKFKSNNRPTENSYTVKDAAGTVYLSQNSFDPNTIYEDNLALPNGCYILEFKDLGGDGLDYWYWGSSVTKGYLEVRKPSTSTALRVFNPDFGNGINYEFVVAGAGLTSVKENTLSRVNFTVYPNPVNNTINLRYLLVQTGAFAELSDVTGRVVLRAELSAGSTSAELHSANLPSGMYTLRFNNGTADKYSKIVKE